MKRKVHKIAEYQGISTDVWQIFKKYFPDDADLDDFVKDVDALDKKYKGDVRQYCFFQALLKVYFNELNELKGVRDAEKNS